MPPRLSDPSPAPSAEAALVHALYDAYLARDEERIFPMLHPDVELNAAPGAGTRMHYRGREALPRYQRQRDAEYDVVRERVSEIIDLGEGRILAIGRILLATPDQRRGFSSLICWLLEVRDGLVTRVCGYIDQDEARREAGLAEHEWPGTERYLGDLADGGASRA